MVAVSLWNQIRSVFKREAAEVKSSVDDLTDRLNADLDHKEAALNATPEEQLRATLDEIESSDDAFDAMRAEIDRSSDDT